jgi:hypothetical protein
MMGERSFAGDWGFSAGFHSQAQEREGNEPKKSGTYEE